MESVIDVQGLGVELLRATGAILSLGFVNQDSYAALTSAYRVGELSVLWVNLFC